MIWLVAVEVPVVLLACLWLVVVGQVLARQRDQEFQVAHLELLEGVVERTALAFRSALGFSPPGEEPVKDPVLFADPPMTEFFLPDVERDDLWADNGPSLLERDDGSFVGFGDAGLPVPPGESGT